MPSSFRIITPSFLLIASALIVLGAQMVRGQNSTESPVGVPVFIFHDGSDHYSGKAFIINWYKGKKLLLCPLHLLGPAGGYSHYVAPESVATVVAQVDVLDLQRQEIVATAVHGLLRKGKPVE